MEDVAHWTVVKDHHLTQVWFNLAQILDVNAVAERTMLPIISCAEVSSLLFEVVDHRVGILLNRCREDNEVIPLADLRRAVLGLRSNNPIQAVTHLLQKNITMRSLVDIV